MSPTPTNTPELHVIRSWNAVDKERLDSGNLPSGTIVIVPRGYEGADLFELAESGGHLAYDADKETSFYDELADRGKLTHYFQRVLREHARKVESSLGSLTIAPLSPEEQADIDRDFDGQPFRFTKKEEQALLTGLNSPEDGPPC